MRTNYVLIDYENVQPDSLDVLDHDYFKILVFVGARQGKVPYAASSGRFGDRMEHIKISGNGSNALDFHIAYYIGRLAIADPSAYFHIISKDTGFDPLIRHLQLKKISASRTSTISKIPCVKMSNSKSAAERIEMILGKLKQLKTAKPGRVKTLSSMIAILFQRRLSEKEVSGLINAMANKGYFTVSGTKIIYAPVCG